MDSFWMSRKRTGNGRINFQTMKILRIRWEHELSVSFLTWKIVATADLEPATQLSADEMASLAAEEGHPDDLPTGRQ